MITLNTRKVIFFLLAYYLCLDPIMYMIGHYITGGNIIFNTQGRFYTMVYIEQIVMVLTIFFIFTRIINVNQYLNTRSKRGFLLYALMFIIINLSFFDVGTIAFGPYYSFSTLLIARGFVFIILGLNIHIIDDLFNDKKNQFVFYTIVLLFIALIIWSSIKSSGIRGFSWYFDGIMKTTISKDTSAMFDYIYISDSLALLLLFIMSRLKSMTNKVLILIGGLFLILLAGSRTSFVCYGFAGMLLLTLMFFKVKKTRFIFPIILVGLFITLAVIYGQLFAKQAHNQFDGAYRFAFVNMDSQSSYILRGLIFERRLDELREIFFFGRYMSEVAEGRPGTYFHNWLSFWSNFGIIPFVLSVIIILSSLNISFRQLHRDSSSPINQLLFLWSIFVVTAISFSRSHDFYYIWFIIFGSAMVSNTYSQRVKP